MTRPFKTGDLVVLHNNPRNGRIFCLAIVTATHGRGESLLMLRFPEKRWSQYSDWLLNPVWRVIA